MAKLVVAPAGDGAVGPHAASVIPPSTDRFEQACRWIGLTKFVVTPTYYGAVGLHTTGMPASGTDGLIQT